MTASAICAGAVVAKVRESLNYTCPKCGKRIELSVDALIAAEYKTVCPQCLSALEIVGDYAYIPLDDGTLDLRKPVGQSGGSATDTPQSPELVAEYAVEQLPQPASPAQLAAADRDPLFDEAVRYLGQCSGITPMMLRDRFGITLERAQSLLAQLEQAGCVGPYRGGAPRQILIDHQQGLPQWMQSRAQDPGATDDAGGQDSGRKIVSINCSSCLIWIVILAFLVFLLIK